MAAVHCALDHGINFFDVSPYYGATVAESRLGSALAGYRDRVILATKCGRYGTEQFDFSAKQIARGLEESLSRLGTDYVDLLQAHDVEFAHADQIVLETIPAMRRLQEQGKARYVGITGYSLRNLVEIASRARVDSILSYCRYNLLISDLDDVLMPFAKTNGVGVINASALHMGILTDRGAPSWHPAPQEVKNAGKAVVELCRVHGVDASELALRHSFAHLGVTSTLVGMSTRKSVEACLRALQPADDSELIAEIRHIVEPVYGCTWQSGLAENYG
jgi:L-galactose dehydrogenase